MMSTTHTAKECAACGAPAVHGRAECWSCGEPLAVSVASPPHAEPIPPPEDYLRPCAACGEVSAIYHRQCPTCGAPLSAALPARPSDVPPGWTGELLPDGVIRLQPDRMTRLLRLGLALIAAIAIAYLGYSYLTMPQTLYTLPTGDATGPLGLRALVRDLGMLVFIGLYLVALVWTLFASEEWEVSADRLVVRKAFLGRKWTRQYSGGTLQVETCQHARGGTTTSLVVNAAQGRATLVTNGFLGAKRVRTLGTFLSRVTGWPFQDGIRNWL